MMKRIIKFICFIFFFVVLWHYVFSIIWLGSNSLTEVYREPKNSLDVAYFGASNAYAHFNTTLAYHEYGFTTGMMSTDSQPVTAVRFLMEEIQKRQKPTVYVIDISSAYDISHEEGPTRKVIDSLKPSLNRLEATKYFLEQNNVPKEEYRNYYFSFFTYHNLYKGISVYRFKNPDIYKGSLLASMTVQSDKTLDTHYKWHNLETNLDAQITKAINELMDYIEQNKLNVLFVVSPRVYNEKNMAQMGSIINLLEENNFKVLNLNDKLGKIINYKKDFYNYAHLNVYGATKMTEYLAKYLDSNYNLDDHRNDVEYKSWDTEYQRFKDTYRTLTEQNFDDLLTKNN